jgi:hypothetical protein
VFVFGVGADDEEVVGGGDAAVAGASGKNEDIAGVNSDSLAAFAAEDKIRVTGCEAEDFVGGRVVVMEGVDAIAPLRWPSVGREDSFHVGGEVGA